MCSIFSLPTLKLNARMTMFLFSTDLTATQGDEMSKRKMIYEFLLIERYLYLLRLARKASKWTIKCQLSYSDF